MKLREYFLINERNRRYELRNVKNKTIMSDLQGLGYRYNTKYVRVGNAYKLDNKELEQGTLSAEIAFLDYMQYQEFIRYIEQSENLRLIYKPLNVEYFRDVDFVGIDNITKKFNLVQANITLNCKGLYYTEESKRFVVEELEGESRWPLPFPFTFNDYSSVAIDINNTGHTEGEILAEIFGYTEQPMIELIVDGKTTHKVVFDITVQEGERLLYSAKDGDNYVMLEDAGGNQTNVWSCMSLENDNFFKLPKGVSTLRVTSQTGVMNKIVFRILTAYKGV